MQPQAKHSVKNRYEFGPFRLDAGERLLYRNGEVVPLTSKVFDILLVFVANSGRTLEKEEVIGQVWPGQIVEEGNLTRNVSTLRKALGESPDEHRYIVTMPGRGYRFVAEVREATDEDVVKTVDDAAPLPSPFTSRRRSIALALAALVVLLASVAGLAGWYFRPKPSPPLSRAVPLTSYPGFERHPDLSPDGNQVAFSWNGAQQDNFDIYIKLIGSSSEFRLTKNPAEDGSPAWSPDGRTIAFIRRLDSNQKELLLIPALGGLERKLAEIIVVDSSGKPPLDSLAWTPDGRWLAVAHREAVASARVIIWLNQPS